MDLDKNEVIKLYEGENIKKSIMFSEKNYEKIMKIKIKERLNLSQIVNYLVYLYNNTNSGIETTKEREWEDKKHSSTIYINKEIMKKAEMKMFENGTINFHDLVNKLIENYL